MTGVFLAIPTYWGPDGGADPDTGDMYDHPTPLKSAGTLRRTLDSLAPLVGPGVRVAVVAAATHPGVASAVELRVRQVIEDPPLPYPVTFFSTSHLEALRTLVAGRGQPSLTELLSLKGYGAIRNLTLILANLWDAGVLVSLDDDEVVEDPDFLDRLTEDLKILSLNEKIVGLAGVYVDAAGNLLAPEPDTPWARFWPKIKKMNDTWRELLEKNKTTPLPRTPMALGGNMVIPQALYRLVPFDPRIPRGEDVDYVMNARLFGISFFLDPELRVLHLPPAKPHPRWRRLRQDVLRFAYARRKLRGQQARPGLAPLTPEELMPYPGAFLTEALEELVVRSHTLLALEYLAGGDGEGARQTLENITRFYRESEAPDNAWLNYLELAGRWQGLQAWLAQPETAVRIRTALWGDHGVDPGAP
jgi:hypothetical protein